MNNYLVDNNSDKLLLFFAGWGCDEYEFEHLKSDSDVLILYNYTDLDLDFDFSKYKEINLLAFSAGVFVASIFDFKFELGKNLGFIGEDGFTSIPQDVLIMTLATTEDTKEIN